MTMTRDADMRLNAPYDAWCFLTCDDRRPRQRLARPVLMHLLALGAF